VPVFKNGGFLRFYRIAGDRLGFFAAPTWGFSPQIGKRAFPMERAPALP
jgi:hypothetical protein